MDNTPDLNALMAKIDLGKLGALASKVDLAGILNAASNMNDKQLQQLGRALGVGGSGRKRELPAADGDFYDYLDTLTDAQVEIAGRVHQFMRAEVMPIMNDYWSRDEFPRQLIGKMSQLNLLRAIWNEDGTRRPDATLVEGIITLEACRVDVSTAVFLGYTGAGLRVYRAGRQR
ncbi:acyl-CoA dehydrogenase family protein [Deinococcus lacus]|uniref:Acyl-CoA dehydrogenase family protein n=1 Tax=Deinococcus lacus TaxID=392561 RepID=A0ABW1YFE3_9DEIO